jgi:hypothetical protein
VRGEFGDQFDDPVGVPAAAAGEQDVLDAVLGGQVPGENAPEPPGAASDQHGPVGAPGRTFT